VGAAFECALLKPSCNNCKRLDAIGQITSGVAHDFNNLLSVVLTNANLLLRNVRNPDDQEGVDLIRAAAERGCRMGKAAVQPQTALMNAQSSFA
jgi:signal transduction histidine kinase